MAGKADLMELGTMALGAAGGAAVSRYGSNAISDALTKDEPHATQVDIEALGIWRKAPFWDVALGAVAGLAGIYAVKGSSRTSRMTSTALKSAGVYLVANGVLDIVGDFSAKGQRQTNGRPLHYAADKTTVLGAQRRMSGQRLTSQAFVPSASRGKVALF